MSHHSRGMKDFHPLPRSFTSDISLLWHRRFLCFPPSSFPLFLSLIVSFPSSVSAADSAIQPERSCLLCDMLARHRARRLLLLGKGLQKSPEPCPPLTLTEQDFHFHSAIQP